MHGISLYVHVPFCRKKCRYCDFYSVPYDAALADAYLSALSDEIEIVKRQQPCYYSPRVRTVFIGGGTPSILSVKQLASLCGLLRASFVFEPDLEWTVECNPESFTREKAAALIDAGVTRLTFGFQSLDDRELSFLGRAHTAERCREILADQELGKFDSIGIDLMYGLPGQTAGTLERSLQQVFESPHVKHISAYELTMAYGTPFGRHRSMLSLPDEEAMSVMTGRLWELLESHGFMQYEVSNFAKAGHECRHNRVYWNHDPYLGLGCAAHSFLHPVRTANIRDVKRYGTMVKDGRFPLEFIETIDAKKIGMEMIFLGLRTTQGINEKVFFKKVRKSFPNFANKEKIRELMRCGLLVYEKPFWKPTKKGLLMADGIAREII
ncbi:MAG: radical SAM family heme chaperone HemW [Chitinispirillaceae bacterium]|nr:radical SAM family heme chaperone HemW [Chitinispirillaceae bacterium]